MTVNVTATSTGWKATPESDPLYTITIEGQGEPQKTYDAALAVLGTHEAESYQSKSGKTYWRKPKPGFRGGSTKAFKADPEKMKQEYTLEVAKNQSIQRQVAVKAAVELVVAGKRDNLTTAYVQLMDLLAEPDWQKFDPLNPADVLPTDEEVEQQFEESFPLEDLPL